MQYDAARAQRPAVQDPEQHSVPDVQALFAVTQVGVGEIDLQVPPLQLPVQQAFPATGQAAPIVRHWVPPQCPATQAPLQQSVLPAQAAVAGAQTEIDEPQVSVLVSQTPEQHEAPNEQCPLKAVQVRLTLPSGPNPPSRFHGIDPSTPAAPSAFPELAPSSPGAPSEGAPSSPALESSLPAPSWERPLSSALDASPRGPFADPLEPHPAIAVARAAKAHQPKRFIVCSLSVFEFVSGSTRVRGCNG
jgi:hypothetical protein